MARGMAELVVAILAGQRFLRSASRLDFGIAVGVVWRDVENALSQLHGERVDTGETLIGHNPMDELARRRNRAV